MKYPSASVLLPRPQPLSSRTYSKCLEMEVWDASSIAVPSLLAVFKAHDSRVPQRSCGQPDLSSQALSVSALKISSMNFSLRDGLS